MAKIDRLKEEIGWLKVVFAALLAIGASLVGWLAQNYETAGWFPVSASIGAIVAASYSLARVNRVVYARLYALEEP